MTAEQKNEIISKLEEATKANGEGQYRVANMYIQDVRAALYGMPDAAQPAPLADAALAELEALIKNEEEAYTSHNPFWGEIRDDAFRRVYNSAPGLLARLRTAEAKLQKVVQRLPSMAQELGDAEDLADTDHGDGYEACYNAAGNVRGAITGLLRDLNLSQGKEANNA
jgi:hypothetical protein